MHFTVQYRLKIALGHFAPVLDFFCPWNSAFGCGPISKTCAWNVDKNNAHGPIPVELAGTLREAEWTPDGFGRLLKFTNCGLGSSGERRTRWLCNVTDKYIHARAALLNTESLSQHDKSSASLQRGKVSAAKERCWLRCPGSGTPVTMAEVSQCQTFKCEGKTQFASKRSWRLWNGAFSFAFQCGIFSPKM